MKRLGCLLGAAAYGKRPQNRSENLFAPEPLSERRDVSAAPGWPPAQCDIRLRLRHRGKSRESCKSLLFFLARPVAATKLEDSAGRARSAVSGQRSA